MWSVLTWVVIGCEVPLAPEDPSADVGGRRASLQVSLAPGLVTGVTSTYTVSGADPGETVTLVGSVDGVGAGPCPPKFGGKCLGVLVPKKLGDGTADGSVLLQGVYKADLRQSDFMFNEEPAFIVGVSTAGSDYVF